MTARIVLLTIVDTYQSSLTQAIFDANVISKPCQNIDTKTDV